MKKNIEIEDTNFFAKKYLKIKNKKIKNKNFLNILNSIKLNKNTESDVFCSLNNKFKLNFKIKDIVKFKKFKTVVIIGMGGSILGSQAIYCFLKKKIKKNFIFLNNINEVELNKLKKKNLIKILFIVISKSGNTIETLSNISVLKIIKKNSKNIIIISEKSNNPLYLLSKKFNLFHIEHRNYIGGRYSVLSEVGLLPAYLMGVNIFDLRKKLLSHLNSKNIKIFKKSVFKLTTLYQDNKLKNIIFFNYVPELNKFLYWSQQLIAESLGKKGKGFLPIISPAPKDHHSLLQLYLDGPRDKIFYIFSSNIETNNKIKPYVLENKFNFLKYKSLNKIKAAQKNAFLKTLKTKGIQFREFKIKSITEEVLGELFSYFILETVAVGKMSNTDPFNQPAVEQVKHNTKKLLL